MRNKNEIRVVELFAGVGGFRLGLEAANKDIFKTVWSNQWEPKSTTQHASEIYIKTWGDKNHSNQDINKVIRNNWQEIPDHDLLVGGFPCQDYSVARTLSQADGLKGKKGVLWWSIYEILKRKKDEKKAPKYILLENVDRLLKSPAKQRGRDFAVMLSSLAGLGYAIEWRVVNAAEYGLPQRRRRVFIIGYKLNTPIYKSIKKSKNLTSWLVNESLSSEAFPIKKEYLELPSFELNKDLAKVSKEFSMKKPAKSPFEIMGAMFNYHVVTLKVQTDYAGKIITLGDIVKKTKESEIPEEFYISEEDFGKWKTLKDKKNEERTTKSGHTYHYSEGAMPFPDLLEKPARTIVTGEGGKGPSRFKHVVKTPSGRFRRLIPEELEAINTFPKGHTKYMLKNKETSAAKRAFLMGNALVVGVIERFGRTLIKRDAKR